MNFTPIEVSSSRRIGVVEFVSPDEIKVGLDVDAPEGVASNAGIPREFPKINGYVLIPIDVGYIVGQIEWITIERFNFPKRKGYQDFGLVDLPFPHRKMKVNPLGVLSVKQSGEFDFQRGVQSFPSVGEPVILPTDEQVKSIIESGQKRRVTIGTSPLAANAEVAVDPDKLFGRHLAVLGNTGSGKSCSVAGLIQWSFRSVMKKNKAPNARFIILDPNGEYARVFNSDKSDIKAKIFSVGEGESKLEVPMWLWNSHEWTSFVQASARAQGPILRRALREVRAGRSIGNSQDSECRKLRLRRYLSSALISLRNNVRTNAIKNDESKVGFRLKSIKEDLENWNTSDIVDSSLIKATIRVIQQTISATFKTFTNDDGELVEYFRSFTLDYFNKIDQSLIAILDSMGGIIYEDGPSEDTPLPFKGTDLADHVEILAEQEGVGQFVDFLVMRIRTMLSDNQMKPIIGDNVDVNFITWLEQYLGNGEDCGCNVTVIDLSLVPAEIIHVVTAVIARITFEALQRYKKASENNKPLPTVLVMEEAHTFIKRYKDEVDGQNAASVCCKVFEKIAREGRKFGLGLVLSSQRPSELSPTVLSQCNTFLLHRISNDRDQELVYRLVPDSLRGLLRDLPSLPSQYAILLGWATELPVLVKMKDLKEHERPHSDDPDFWDVWTGQDGDGNTVKREVAWRGIAEEWQQSQGIEQEQCSDVDPTEIDEDEINDLPF